MTSARALGLVAGFALDRLLGDPRRGHPVAAFGTVAARLEKRTYATRRRSGIVHVALLVGGVVASGVVLERGSRFRYALAWRLGLLNQRQSSLVE